MPAVLAATAQGSVGNASVLTFNMTIPSLGGNGLILVAGMGREQTGDENPEHPQSATFNGIAMEVVLESGSEQTAGALFALRGPSIPPAGTYSVSIFYSGNNTAEFHHGVAAAWRRVRNQVNEAENIFTSSSETGRRVVSLSSLTNNALVVGVHWWRVGFGETQYSDLTHIITDRADNQGGISMYAKSAQLPGIQSFDVDAGNTESQGLFIAAWETMKPSLPIGAFF